MINVLKLMECSFPFLIQAAFPFLWVSCILIDHKFLNIFLFLLYLNVNLSSNSNNKHIYYNLSTLYIYIILHIYWKNLGFAKLNQSSVK